MLLAIAFLIVWKVFTVENVVVEGNELYSSEQIEQLVLNDEYSWNSLYVLLKYRIRDTGWSSDVCSSDLLELFGLAVGHHRAVRLF